MSSAFPPGCAMGCILVLEVVLLLCRKSTFQEPGERIRYLSEWSSTKNLKYTMQAKYFFYCTVWSSDLAKKVYRQIFCFATQLKQHNKVLLPW